MKKFRFFIINTDSEEFINYFYKTKSFLKKESFQKQHTAWMNTCYGTSDFYSKNLRKHGHEAVDIIYNHEYMQKQWAKENHPLINLLFIISRVAYVDKMLSLMGAKSIKRRWLDAILSKQIQTFKPDIIYCMALESISSGFFNRIKRKYPYVQMVIGQHAAPLTKNMQDLSSYNLILSTVPALVQHFRNKGVKSEYFKLGFEPSVLKHVKVQKIKDDVVFIGSLSYATRKERTCLIDVLSSRLSNIKIYGNMDSTISKDSPIRKKNHNKLFGAYMYQKLLNSKIAINCHFHTEIYGNFACNMRLYEVTGVGSLLITDNIPNISNLFIPGKEVVVYDSPEDCIKKIKYYLNHEKERNRIAKAGQRRTQREHAYYSRMKELIQIINKHIENQ